MVNKPAASSKAIASTTAGNGGKFRSTVVGDYFFVVMVFPVNAAPAGAQIMYPTGTWHFMSHAAQGGEVSGFKLQVSGTAAMTGNALRIEILDLDASFRSEQEVQDYLAGDGGHWLAGAIDHRICRATINPRQLTEI